MQHIVQSLYVWYVPVKLWVWRRVWLVLVVVVAFGLLIFAAPAYAVMRSHGDVYSATAVPKRDVAIVFGAGISNGMPSAYLENRLLAAIQLYSEGKVKVLLMSGDNSRVGYDEPTAMKNYVIAHGVPAKAVVLDYAGFDTYDTCYRAHALFGVKSAILVSHGYHLPRALMTCNSLGVRSVGVATDHPFTNFPKNYYLRELFSLNKAAMQLTFHSRPDLLGPKEKGVSTALAQDGVASWSAAKNIPYSHQGL